MTIYYNGPVDDRVCVIRGEHFHFLNQKEIPKDKFCIFVETKLEQCSALFSV